MKADAERLGSISAAYGIAAGPLQNLMNAIAGHNWTTQGLADVILFVGLGLVLSNTHMVEKIKSDSLISFLVGAVLVAGVGLFAWYTMF